MFGSNNSKGQTDGERIEEVREIDETGNHKDTNTRGGKGSKGQRTPRGSGGGNGGNGGKGGLLMIGSLFIIGLISAMIFTDFNPIKELTGTSKATPFQHMDSMLNSMTNTNKVNQKEGEMHPVYDTNELHNVREVLSMGEVGYLVYAFTETSVDDEFNQWVLDHDSEFKIYRAYAPIVSELNSIDYHLTAEERTGKPYAVYIQGVGDSKDIVTVATSIEDLNYIKETYINPVVEVE